MKLKEIEKNQRTQKLSFYLKDYNINKPLASLRKRRKRTQIAKSRNERGDITSSYMDIQR